MAMSEGHGDITTNDRRFTIERAATRIGVDGVAHDHAQRPDRHRPAPSAGMSRCLPEQTYLVTAKWGNGALTSRSSKGAPAALRSTGSAKRLRGCVRPDAPLAPTPGRPSGAAVRGRNHPGHDRSPGVAVRQPAPGVREPVSRVLDQWDGEVPAVPLTFSPARPARLPYPSARRVRSRPKLANEYGRYTFLHGACAEGVDPRSIAMRGTSLASRSCSPLSCRSRPASPRRAPIR